MSVGNNLTKVTVKDSIDLGTGEDTVTTADATLNASDKAAYDRIAGADVLATSATALVTIDANAFASTDKFAITAADAAGFSGAATAGDNSITLTSDNSDVFTISADRHAEDAGVNATTASTANTGANGGTGIASMQPIQAPSSVIASSVMSTSMVATVKKVRLHRLPVTVVMLLTPRISKA